VALVGGFAAWADDARAYFLPGIWVDGTYAAVLAGSALIGRPLVGYAHGWLFGPRRRWWEDRRVRRTFAAVTLGWAAVYALRAGVQTALYHDHQAELLAVTKLALGWPLTVLGLAVSLTYLRKRSFTTTRRRARPGTARARG
jgi:hypothetical protein